MTIGRPRLLGTCLVLLVVVPQMTLAAFVPAVPAIAEDLHVPTSAVDRSLTWYMAGYAISMALAGGLSTRIDPRRVQLCALLLHTLSSLGVVLATDASTLSTARFLQAVGAGAGTVLARVYVHEIYDEKDRLPALTRLSTAIALTPALSPPVTGVLLEWLPWRVVLAPLAALGAGASVLAWRTLPLSSMDTSATGPDLRTCLHDKFYWWFTASICLAWCVYFTFTTYSSHTLQVHLGVSTGTYGLLYALVVAGYVLGSRAARRYGDRLGLERALATASAVSIAATVTVTLGVQITPAQPLVLVVPMAAAMLGIGAAFPLCQAGMLRSVGPQARGASGLFFFLQMTSGAAYTGVLGLGDPSTPTHLTLAVLLPAAGLVLVATAARPRTKVPQPA